MISRRNDNGLAVSRKTVAHEGERFGADVTAVEKIARDQHQVVPARKLDDVDENFPEFITKPLSRRKIDPGEGRIKMKVARVEDFKHRFVLCLE